jgi:hypothetical protein
MRDAVLILAVLGLGALALLPGREPAERDAAAEAAARPAGDNARIAHGDVADADRDAGARSSPPAKEGTLHGLLPLVPGSEWSYRVSGPAELVPTARWVLRLVSAPEGGAPGVVEAGFGDGRESGRVWIGDGWIFVDALPLLEPAEFAGNRPRRVSGTLLPAPGALVDRATWELVLERLVTHTIRDELERPVTRPMRAVQRDRALVEGFDEVAVPAGEFRAARVEWISRLELFAGRRQVFDALTLEQFRSETMWIAPGIGIVKRQIAWAGSPKSAVTFQLERYHRPGP